MNNSSGYKLDIKLLGFSVALLSAITSPFIAVGGYKEKIISLERRAEASESSIEAIKASRAENARILEGRLSRIETLLGEILKAVK